jgi:hypothetical protein
MAGTVLHPFGEAIMNAHLRICIATAAVLALGAGDAFAASPLRVAGFGPPVSGDASLNANIGVLAQKIAWDRSPESDVFQLAIATPGEEPFDNVAMASDPMPGARFSPAVRNDPSLNANEAALAQWIAYRNSPQGDAFDAAQPQVEVASAVFLRVALASIPRGSVDIRSE